MHRYFLFLVLIAAGFFAIDFCNRYAQQKWWIPWLVFSPFALISVGFGLFITATPWWGDFEAAYYPSGYALQYNLEGLYSNNCVDGFVNVPLVAVLFVPFSYLDYPIAVGLFTFAGIMALGAACVGLIKLFDLDRRQSLMLAGLFVINGPAFYSIKEANTSHFMLLLLVGMLFLLKYRRDFALGSLIVLGTLIKVPLGLLGVYFFMRRRWRTVSGMLVTAVITAAISLLAFGLEPHMIWLQQCIAPYAGMPVAAFNVQSIDGFLARLFTDNQLMNWHPLIMDSSFYLVRNGILGILLFGVTAVLWRAGKPRCIEEEYLEFSIILCVLLLIFPLSWTHYYVFMLVPFGFYIANRTAFPATGYRRVLMLAGIVLVSLPMIGVLGGRGTMAIVASKVLSSHYFLAVLLILLLLLAVRKRTASKNIQSAIPP
ncbi:MAG: hypothetical protein BMS9Abin06_0101 [Gammaproteobacteria bacterium]|nr:MAG: hypothetical protein BMS9Abin06_0101 [Gammaproteobacteria bacterium]